MTRVYSVKSNARRDCRKRSIDPDLVYAVEGGWAVREPQAGTTSKADRLISMLAEWTPISELTAALGWQAHTVRGALSTAAKARDIKIERQRVAGVTSYRAVSA